MNLAMGQKVFAFDFISTEILTGNIIYIGREDHPNIVIKLENKQERALACDEIYETKEIAKQELIKYIRNQILFLIADANKLQEKIERIRLEV
jgi:hypothetical protein